MKKTGKIVKCENCRKEIYKARWQLEKSNRYFCSRECSATMGTYRKCLNCNKEFYVPLWKIKIEKGFYCSIKCRYLSKKVRLKISQSKIGENNPMYGKESWMKGKKGLHLSPKTEFKEGTIPWNKGLGNNTTTERQKEMGTAKYKKWRMKVFQRDRFTCQKCGKKSGKLIADHIKMWALFIQLRYRVSNGQTLCESCNKEKTRKEMSIYWKNQYKKSKALILIQA